MEDYDRIFIKNPVTRARLEGVGVLKKEDAIRLGIVGPNLRASGAPYDVRRIKPYCAYPELEFDVVVREEGDSMARLLVRIGEIKQSMRIIRQALKQIPDGPILSENYLKMIPPKWKEFMEKNRRVKFPAIMANLRPKKGEALSRVEAARGELVYYIVSDGTPTPYRFRMVTPSFRNVVLFEHLIRECRVADIPAIYGSLDYFPPEADR